MDERDHDLIDRVYEAAIRSDAWQEVVGGVSEIFGRSPAMLGFFPQGEVSLVPSYFTGLRQPYLPRYAEYLENDLGWSARHMARFADRFVDFSEVFDHIPLEQTHTLTTEAGDPIGALTVFRVDGQGPFTEDECCDADQYVPHLRRAVDIHVKLHGVQRVHLALAEVMDRLPMGMLLLDSARQVVVQNRAAERIFASDDGLRIDRGGPNLADVRENAAFQLLIADAMEGKVERGFASRGFLSVSRPSGRRPLSVMVTPLRGVTQRAPVGEAVVALFVTDPEEKRISGAKALERLYGLTQSEAQILQLLSMGMSLEEAADERGVSMNTARSHIKHMFSKTGVSRQGELVRMILNGVGAIRGE
jgi:DNA-binding CsgD family transcriptional regulator